MQRGSRKYSKKNNLMIIIYVYEKNIEGETRGKKKEAVEKKVIKWKQVRNYTIL